MMILIRELSIEIGHKTPGAAQYLWTMLILAVD